MSDSDTNITVMLSAIKRGDSRAAEQLLPVVYEELRKLATFLMGREKPRQALQPTALVYEAYMKMQGARKALPRGMTSSTFSMPPRCPCGGSSWIVIGE